MTEENWYELVKNEADLDGFFAGTGLQYLWIGDEKERKPCGLTIFPVEEELLEYSCWEMDRLPDGTICFKDEFIPEFVRKSRKVKRYWVSINICQLSIEEELLIRKHNPQTEKEMKDVIAMACCKPKIRKGVVNEILGKIFGEIKEKLASNERLTKKKNLGKLEKIPHEFNVVDANDNTSINWCGDNIYKSAEGKNPVTGELAVKTAFHHENGCVKENKEHDLSGEYVLVSDSKNYIYYGKQALSHRRSTA